MVKGDKEGWLLLGKEDTAREIISAAINSDNLEAQNAAVELINFLGARGYLKFRDLLK
jgi:hypothetical protein